MSTMRLAWATPFNIRSAIARFSQEVCDELVTRGIHVEILRTEAPESEDIDILPSKLTAHRASTQITDEFLRSFDATIVNVGNYNQFHSRALPMMARSPLISIIHDADLRDFAAGAATNGLPLAPLGRSLSPMGHPPFANAPGAAEMMLLASLSAACVAHGRHYVDMLKAACPGPVGVIPLCFPDIGSINAQPSTDGRLIVTTFGMINSNKQPDRVMRAIAASPELKTRATYRLVGPIEDAQRSKLGTLARELGLNPLEIHGRVSDERLCELLATSDVICCLRHPVSEGGSASLITALFAGRPLIVPRYASYDDVPDELVWKVSYGNRNDDVSAALQAIDQDRAAAELRVKTTREWALKTYSAQSYADRLLPLIDAAIARAPLIEAGRSIGRILEKMTVTPADAASQRIDLQIEQLFCSANVSIRKVL